MLVVISHSDRVEKENYYIEKFLNEGADYFHIRKPALSFSEIELVIKKIPVNLLPRISIHDNYPLLEKYNIGGIHFTSSSKHLLNNYNNSNLRKSISCHSFEEIKNLPYYIDYTFLSPVFNSISKKNYLGKFNSEKTKNFLTKKFKFEIVALGGVSEKNIHTVKELGFTNAAVLGCVWNNPENTSILKEIKKYV